MKTGVGALCGPSVGGRVTRRRGGGCTHRAIEPLKERLQPLLRSSLPLRGTGTMATIARPLAPTSLLSVVLLWESRGSLAGPAATQERWMMERGGCAGVVGVSCATFSPSAAALTVLRITSCSTMMLAPVGPVGSRRRTCCEVTNCPPYVHLEAEGRGRFRSLPTRARTPSGVVCNDVCMNAPSRDVCPRALTRTHIIIRTYWDDPAWSSTRGADRTAHN